MVRRIANICIIIFVLASFFVLKDDIVDLYNRFRTGVSTYLVEQNILSENLLERKYEIRLPGPLRALSNKEHSDAKLTATGIVMATNEARSQESLPDLSVNTKLNESARMKVQDMFERAYFEHISPDGIGVGDLAETAGYAYILVGENLAQGNFGTDQAVVTAWMNSEGHRANILHPRYTEIGVAVMKGEFEGETLWMAVQHFGVPQSACPDIQPGLQEEILSSQEELEELEDEIKTLEAEIEETSKFNSRYNDLVEEYNQKVEIYNTLLVSVKEQVTFYNSQVRSYNSCVEGKD